MAEETKKMESASVAKKEKPATMSDSIASFKRREEPAAVKPQKSTKSFKSFFNRLPTPAAAGQDIALKTFAFSASTFVGCLWLWVAAVVTESLFLGCGALLCIPAFVGSLIYGKRLSR